jgi:hypothetical protein
MNNTEIFTNAYIECMLWADSPEDMIGTLDASNIDSESLETIKQDCISFLNLAEKLIQTEPNSFEGSPYAQAGHDFWLTRNRHGAGFWDGKWQNGDDLTYIAQQFKEKWLQVDNGIIYVY